LNINRLLGGLKKGLLRPPSYLEGTILLIAVSLNLLDSFTTLTFTLTKTGVELNPVLRHLLNINPFLVYPFLLTMMIPILLFRFNSVVEYGVAFLLITIHLTASLNNIGLIISRYSLALPVLGAMDIQFLGFLTGLTYIGGYTLYRCIEEKYIFRNSIRIMSINFMVYLIAYFSLSLIPIIWLKLFIFNI
jgi:hypothetical protein